MTMRGIDHHHVHFSVDQRFGSLKSLVANRGGRGDTQTTRFILGCIGIGYGLLDILDRDQTDTMPVIVDYKQLFRR